MTPRTLYYDIAPYLTPRLKFTLNLFWWNFLSTAVPGPILDPLFETHMKRPRRLSTMMNCSQQKSFPTELYGHLESHLNTEDFLGTVQWTQDVLDNTKDPMDLLRLIQQHIGSDDDRLGFLKAPVPKCGNEKLFFIAACRLTWLGFYTLYADRTSQALKKLKNNPVNSEECLWSVWIQQHVPQKELKCDADSAVKQLLPYKISEQETDPNDGWYAVANWTDEYVCINDRPSASCDGGKVLGNLSNGTVLFVTGVPNYNGLHCSSGQWGKTTFGGIDGYVPMNLMVKLKI